MPLIRPLLICFFSLISWLAQAQMPDLMQYVQPLSGTGASTTPASLRHSEGTETLSHTIPAVGVPFGMTQWTPQTQLTEKKCLAPYYYRDTLLSGFRGTHWLSGSCVQDYGSFTVMPITGSLQTSPQAYAAPFSHRQETSSPAHYQVTLPRYGLQVDLTGTARCGMLQFTASQADSLYLLILPNSDEGQGFVRVNDHTNEIWGYNPVHRIYQGSGEQAGFSGYFVIQVERKIESSGTFSGSQVFRADSILNQKEAGAFVGFRVRAGEQVRIRIGTSFSSLAGARKNLAAEIPGWDLKEVVAQTTAVWQRALGQIHVETANPQDKRIFYTALFHAQQHPRLYNDVDGTYPAFGGNRNLHRLDKGNYYDDLSMWDIYRAQLPLLEVLRPDLVNDLVQSLVLKGQQGGWLPIFPCWNSYTSAMIGDHASAFMASAMAKGFRDFEVAEAYRLMRQNAFETPNRQDYRNGMGRRALPSYLQHGYVPLEDSVPDAFHQREQVSRTLEYAYDDYALAIAAKTLGKTADYEILRERALNYRHVFDPQVGLMRGRSATGRWYQPYWPDRKEPYITEGTPRQYSFYVPQDIPGLAKLMGGPARLEAALDSLFAKGEYWHGNEPGHQIPFLYNYTASPGKTQQQVRRILREEYSDGPGGLSGNDDAGQMSAWYVFAALGLYPVNPVSGELLLASPIFDRAVIRLANGKTMEITCHKEKPEAMHIAKVRWNGKRHDQNYVRYADLMQGGKLALTLQEKPSMKWGTKRKHQPSGL